MTVDALCIGHASFDLSMSVDSFPAENDKLETDSLIESGGGPAANAAFLLARWGIPTGLAALLGDDHYGHRALAELQQGRVDCGLLELRSGHVTPVSFVITSRSGGSRTIVNRKAPDQFLKLSSESLKGINPKLLLFDGHELEASLAALNAFPSAMTVLDAGSRRKGTEVLACHVQYLVCSSAFAVQMIGQTDLLADWKSCLQKLRHANGQVVVVTLGERGLMFTDGNDQGRIPALETKAVDTTAAGDVFHGAFAFGLLRGMDLRAALRLAIVAAGLSVQKPGGRPSIPELSQVLTAMPHE